MIADEKGMTRENSLSAWFKVVVCLLFAIALTFFPPSASHAASGMHGTQQATSDLADSSDAGHTHGVSASHGESDIASQTEQSDQSSGQCCSGICVSVVLSQTNSIIAEIMSIGEYLILHEQTSSIEPSGLLRPPQHLI